MFQAAKWLSIPGLLTLTTLLVLPVFSPNLAQFEGLVAPVVTPVVILNEVSHVPSGHATPAVDFIVRFRKWRDCDFVSVIWLDITKRRLRLDFEITDGQVIFSRPEGEHVSGPWRVWGVDTLAETTAYAAHKCSTGLVYSPFYP